MTPYIDLPLDNDDDEDYEDDDYEDDEEIARDAKELFATALYFLSDGQWLEAHRAASEARDLFDELNMAKESAETRLVMGFVDYELGNFKAALPMLASAQQQFSSAGCKAQQCATLYLLTYCHLGLEKPSKAIYTLKLAQTVFKSNPEILNNAENSQVAFLPDIKRVSETINSLLIELEAKYPSS
ncbi:MAG: hypothetical protein HY819_02190 [Acidobacteria bacterium]|nr:hypothetical protein [Acidobacteriota bacterium]